MQDSKGTAGGRQFVPKEPFSVLTLYHFSISQTDWQTFVSRKPNPTWILLKQGPRRICGQSALKARKYQGCVLSVHQGVSVLLEAVSLTPPSACTFKSLSPELTIHTQNCLYSASCVCVTFLRSPKEILGSQIPPILPHFVLSLVFVCSALGFFKSSDLFKCHNFTKIIKLITEVYGGISQFRD